MEIGLILVAATQTYNAFGVVACLGSIFVCALFLPFFYRENEHSAQMNTIRDELLFTKPLPDSGECSAINIAVNKNSYLITTVADDLLYNFDHSVFGQDGGDADKFDFIYKLQSSLVESRYSNPTLLKRNSVQNKSHVIAFYNKKNNICGLEYKNSCMIISSDKIKDFFLVEYTCRGGYSHSLCIHAGEDMIEMDFYNLKGNTLGIYKMSISFARAWNSKLRLDFINLN